VIGQGFDAILADAQSGSEPAFATIYHDLSGAVRGLAIAKGVRDADDVMTETMISVAKSLGKFQGDEGAFRSWVFTIAYRRIADEYRRQSRRVKTVELTEGSLGAETESAEQRALAFELSPQVDAALATLSSDQRDVLLLRVLGGLSLGEVSKILGKQLGSVKMLQSRAIKSMASFLDADVALVPALDDRGV
jgi:RNA polymerase sigma-70 factor, ECF subfamily